MNEIRKVFLFSVFKIRKGMGSTWRTAPLLCVLLFPAVSTPVAFGAWIVCTGSYSTFASAVIMGVTFSASCLLSGMLCWLIDILANSSKRHHKVRR
jgi:hypothetical protein